MSKRRTAALTPVDLADLMGFQDARLRRYIENGSEEDRKKAEDEALQDLWALCNAISAYEETGSVFTGTTAARLGGLAETLVARLVELRSQGEDRDDD